MITGERIRLRKLERTDLPLFVKWFNDPDVRRGIAQYSALSLDEESSWYDNMLKRPEEERPLGIEIRDGDGWRLIGSTSLFDFNWRSRHAEFGLVIGDKSAWHQGYGTEVTRMMLGYGFDMLNLNKIELYVKENNPYALRAYLRAGYILEGTLRNHVFQEGEYLDLHVLSVLRSEWEAWKKENPPHA